MFLAIWFLAAMVTWIAMLTFTDFVLWDDAPEAIIIGLAISATLCALLWPFVLLATAGSLIAGGD
jgi:hypothetical protein